MQNIWPLIEDAINGGASGPDEIAEKILPQLDGHQEEYLLLKGVRHYVRNALARQRNRHSSVERRPGTSTAYDNIRAVIQAGLWQVRTASGWKPLRECSTADLYHVAGVHHMLADRNTQVAQAYERLAERLEEAGYSVVGDLLETLNDADMEQLMLPARGTQ